MNIKRCDGWEDVANNFEDMEMLVIQPECIEDSIELHSFIQELRTKFTSPWFKKVVEEYGRDKVRQP